jgi:putative ABC transport system ATP-binding protein
MKTIIEAKNLTKVYESSGDDAPALKDITLSITQGESVAIIGKSGSGKSTLMHILATLDRATEGELIIDGREVSGLSSAELDALRNKKFGFVFQQFFVNARNTCLENVTLPLIIMGISPSERNKRGREILEMVGLGDKADKKAGELSGGQKQRLCIARALITKPDLIFADEPTGNLDSENGQRVVELLFKLQLEEGITVVIVTHDPDLAALCDRSIVIKDGRIESMTERMPA